jgi:hypothetical protein
MTLRRTDVDEERLGGTERQSSPSAAPCSATTMTRLLAAGLRG